MLAEMINGWFERMNGSLVMSFGYFYNLSSIDNYI